ncbi:unnamed protein product [Cochlearia groenlandica]
MAPAPATTASSDSSEGPVMALINKRLRALRKKHIRITNMEESISQGKTLHKEQEEVLRSKQSVVVLIEELEKLRSPLSDAVSEEISLATKHHRRSSSSDQKNDAVVTVVATKANDDDDGVNLEDLVNLLYFGSLFDVKSPNDFASIMLTRSHERGCCLTYDYVTEEAKDLLGDCDLDSISKLWSLMVSRPVDSSLSHKNALERCVEHAKLWLANSDKPIESNCNVSYALLREKLKKIMGSDYFTATPEMKAPVDVAAATIYASFQAKNIHTTFPCVFLECFFTVSSVLQEEDAANCKEQESVVNDQSLHDEQQKVESVTEGEVVNGEEDDGFTLVGSKNGKRGYKQEYVPRGSNQRGERGGRRGGRRGYSNGRGGRDGGGGYQNQNGRFESYDQSGGNGYQRSYNNNRGRGRGGGGNGNSYNSHQDSNVTVAS